MSPPVLLLVSSLFSVAGLYAMSSVTGAMIFSAFVLYAIGQTFYWPTMLGLVSEQFPKGGAMTLNTVSAMGLLTVGIFGFPFLGAVQDHYKTRTVMVQEADKFEEVKTDETTFTDMTNPQSPDEKPVYELKNFFGVNYESVNSGEFATDFMMRSAGTRSSDRHDRYPVAISVAFQPLNQANTTFVSGTSRNSDLFGTLFRNIPVKRLYISAGDQLECLEFDACVSLSCEKPQGNGITQHVGDALVLFAAGREVVASVVSHEIGHNLGLSHIVAAENLMQAGGSSNQGERLNAAQIATARASQFSVPISAVPEPGSMFVIVVGLGIAGVQRRRLAA